MEEDWKEYLVIHAVLGAPGNKAYLQAFEDEEGTSSEEEHAKLCLRMISKPMLSLAAMGRGMHESGFHDALDAGLPRH